MAFEKLNLAFVLPGGLASCERAQVATLAGLRIFLAGVQAILSGLQLSDHFQKNPLRVVFSTLSALFLALFFRSRFPQGESAEKAATQILRIATTCISV